MSPNPNVQVKQTVIALGLTYKRIGNKWYKTKTYVELTRISVTY
jgi:hypothetical protein